MVHWGTKARQSIHEHDIYHLFGRDGSDDSDGGNGARFASPFLTFAVVAIAVIVALLVMVFTRVVFIQRRANLAQIEPTSGPVIYQEPKDYVPPIFERRLSAAADLGTHASWDNLQPLSVAFDRDISAHVRSSESVQEMSTSAIGPQQPPAGSVQATFLVSLPTPSMKFPAHLRRRSPSHGMKTSEIDGLTYVNARNSTEKNTTMDMSDNVTDKLRRSASFRSALSGKELGNARREAFLNQMEVTATGGVLPRRVPSVRSNLSSTNQAVLDRHDTLTHEDDEAIGSFALGSLAMNVRQTLVEKAGSHIPLTSDELTNIIHHAQLVRKNYVSQAQQ